MKKTKKKFIGEIVSGHETTASKERHTSKSIGLTRETAKDVEMSIREIFSKSVNETESITTATERGTVSYESLSPTELQLKSIVASIQRVMAYVEFVENLKKRFTKSMEIPRSSPLTTITSQEKYAEYYVQTATAPWGYYTKTFPSLKGFETTY